jgi:surface polysaccharide O-acyltransferase-like enzyme
MEPKSDPPATGTRNGLVDYCRLLAAFGILWFHTETTGYRVGYIAVPFFLVLLSLPSRSGLADRARRLLWPFLIWSVIYALARIAPALHSGGDLFAWWRPSMIFTGTSTHLWFLPFAFLVAVVAPVLRGSGLALVAPVLGAGFLALVGEPAIPPLYQWSFGLIPALVGFAWARAGVWAAVPLGVSFAVLEFFRPSPDNLVILAGAGLAILVLSVRTAPTRFSDWCARVSLWVYLAHVLVIQRAVTMGFEGLGLVVATAVGSVVLAVGIDAVVMRVKGAAGGTAAREGPRDHSGQNSITVEKQ